jgi:hypothetical protein
MFLLFFTFFRPNLIRTHQIRPQYAIAGVGLLTAMPAEYRLLGSDVLQSGRSRSFDGTYRLHLQGRSVSQT